MYKCYIHKWSNCVFLVKLFKELCHLIYGMTTIFVGKLKEKQQQQIIVRNVYILTAIAIVIKAIFVVSRIQRKEKTKTGVRK